MNFDINNLNEKLSIISTYIHRINETFLSENITGYVDKTYVEYRDSDRNWFSKDFCPQINMMTQNIVVESELKQLYICGSKIQDKYLDSLLSLYRVCTKDDFSSEEDDNNRLSDYINLWKLEIPRVYDRDEHLKRLIWDVSHYFNKDNTYRNQIEELSNIMLSPDKDLHLDEFQSNGMVFKVIDFNRNFVELKSIKGLFGEYTHYCKSKPVLPNSVFVKIPAEVYSPCCNIYTVKTLGNGVFNNLTKTETIILPVSLKKCKWSFWNCKKLKSIQTDGYGLEIQGFDGVLYDKNKKTLLAYPNCHGTEYYVPEGVEKLENCSFKDCDNLKILHLPSTLKHIGLNAFYRCYNLEIINCNFSEDNNIIFEGFFGNSGDVHPQWVYNK